MRLKHPSGPQRLRRTTFKGRRSNYSLTTLFLPQAGIALPEEPPPIPAPHLVALAGKNRTPNGHPAFPALWNVLPRRSVWVLPHRNYLGEWQGSTIRDQIGTGCQACRNCLQPSVNHVPSPTVREQTSQPVALLGVPSGRGIWLFGSPT